jgi:hypothetical protein
MPNKLTYLLPHLTLRHAPHHRAGIGAGMTKRGSIIKKKSSMKIAVKTMQGMGMILKEDDERNSPA